MGYALEILSKPDDIKQSYASLALIEKQKLTATSQAVSHDAGTEVWQDVSSRRLCCVWTRCTVAHLTDQKWDRKEKKKKTRERRRDRRVGGREGENCLGSPKRWISSEACFITRLPVWRSAGKSRPCGAAAEIYGSLIISTNTFQYSIVQYTTPTLLPVLPGPLTPSLLLHHIKSVTKTHTCRITFSQVREISIPFNYESLVICCNMGVFLIYIWCWKCSSVTRSWATTSHSTASLKKKETCCFTCWQETPESAS